MVVTGFFAQCYIVIVNTRTCLCDASLFHLSLLYQELIARHGRLAVDYQQEIQQWRDEDYYAKTVSKYQLPFNPLVSSLTFKSVRFLKIRLEMEWMDL